MTDTTLYFGSSSVKAQIAADMTPEQRQDFTIRKQILWQSTDATDAEARAMEIQLIQETGANDAAQGYNLVPRQRPSADH